MILLHGFPARDDGGPNQRLGSCLPVLARAVPGARGGWLAGLGAEAATARAIQRSAVASHACRSEALSQVLRRLDLLAGTKGLRWPVTPAADPGKRQAAPGKRPAGSAQ